MQDKKQNSWLISCTQPNQALRYPAYYEWDLIQPRSKETQLSGLFTSMFDSPFFAEVLPEYAARVCYGSQGKLLTDGTYLLDRVREQHLDVLEHTVISIGMDSPYLMQYSPYVVSGKQGGYREYVITTNLRVWLEMADKNLLTSGSLAILAGLAPTLFVRPPALAIEDFLPEKTISVPEAMRNGYHVALLGANLFECGADVLVKHGSASFYLGGVSRALTHQLVRHRNHSFCLAGDTIVPSFSDRTTTGKKWTMRQLWDWSQDPKRKGRLQLIRLRGIDEEGLIIRVGIKSVVASGQQQLYKICTESGRSIRATAKHRFMTPNGWKTLGELAVGDLVTANGILAYQDKEYVKKRYLDENMERKVLAAELGVADSTLGKWIAKFDLRKPKSAYPNRHPGRGKKGMFTEEERKRISERKQGEKNHWWKGDEVGNGGGHIRAIKMYEATQCERCPSTHRVQRHHVDGNPANNLPENIRILCELCHKADHYGLQVRKVFSDKIVSIEKDAIEDTYDLEVNHVCHNFVADGLVVHNSQESQRYTDLKKQNGRPVIPPSIAQNAEAFALYEDTMRILEERYEQLRAMKIRKEDARYLLPNAASTKIVVTAQFDNWLHFLHLRAADKAAQWEIREIAYQVGTMLEKIAPGVFGEVMVRARSIHQSEGSVIWTP
jgi:hypothetical protein